MADESSGRDRDQPFRLWFPYFGNQSASAAAAPRPLGPTQRQQSLPPQRPAALRPSQPAARSQPRSTTQRATTMAPTSQPIGRATPTMSPSLSPSPSQVTTRRKSRSTTQPTSPQRTPLSKSPERPQQSKPTLTTTPPTTAPSPPPPQSASPPQQSQTTPIATASPSEESKQEALDPLVGVKPTQTAISEKAEPKPNQMTTTSQSEEPKQEALDPLVGVKPTQNPISEKEEAKPNQAPLLEEKIVVEKETKQNPQMIILKGEAKPTQFPQIEKEAPDDVEANEKRETNIEPKQSTQPTQVPQVKEKHDEKSKERTKPIKPVHEGDSKEIEMPETIKETEEKDNPTNTFREEWKKKMKAKAQPNPNPTVIIRKDEIKQNGEENGSWPEGEESEMGASNTTHASASRGSKSFQREVAEGVSKLFQKLNTEHGEHGASVIALGGENNGATMTVNKEGDFPMQRSYKLNENKDEATTNEREVREEAEITTNINCNVQSINNSILHESSCSAKNPGVHFVFSSKSKKKKPYIGGSKSS